MIFILLVNLYTVRVIWDVLGQRDYGLYSVVGGLVTMFAFLNNAMVSSSQRFLSYELGTGNTQQLQKVFRISTFIHQLIAISIFILGETLGFWFVNTKLNIPPGRELAANWVFQCSLGALIFTILSVPYNASIVAHEHMKIYGYFGIIEAVLKLLIVFVLYIIPGDKLIIYAILVLSVTGTMRIGYTIYCKKKFVECTSKEKKDYNILRSMVSFAGWSFLGNMGITFKEQGLNVILNLYFNVAINASKAIASQIGGATNAFVGYFQMAMNPQITKRYASGEISSMLLLITRGCKYSLLLMSAMIIPLYSLAPQILEIWIQDAQPLTIGFVRLSLIVCLLESIVGPITTTLQATGKIKYFQIIISIIALSNLPIAWVLLKFYAYPYIVMFVSMGTSVIATFFRIYLLHKEIQFSYKSFLMRVFSTSIPLIIIFFGISAYLTIQFQHHTIILISCNVMIEVTFLVCVYLLVLNNSERVFLKNLIRIK